MPIIKEIKEEISKIDSSEKKLKTFGYLVGFILILIGALWLRKSSMISFWPWLVGLVGLILMVLARLKKIWLRGTYKVWMGFSVVLGFFVSRFILSIVFYVILTPLNLLARLWKVITGKAVNDVETYWLKPDNLNSTKEEIEKPY